MPATRREVLALASGAAVGAATAGVAGPAAAHPAVPVTIATQLRAPAGGYVAAGPGPGRFPLTGAPVVVSSADHPGVLRVAGDLRADLHRVTGVEPVLGHDTIPAGADPIILGTLGRSPLIDRIVARGRPARTTPR